MFLRARRAEHDLTLLARRAHPSLTRPTLHFAFLVVVAVSTMGALCDPPITATEISRERAIEIARQEVNLNADSVEAVRATSEGPDHQAIWRVTLKRRLPDQPQGLFETHIVEIDARTGKIVGLSTS
jgi:hypothetical protein